MTYKVGIIGCGFIGVNAPDSHLRAYRACPATKVVAVCDTDRKRILEVKLNYCKDMIPFWENYIQMVQQNELDIVSVCTSPDTHCQIVCDIAPFVKAIYCEKPIALTLEEVDKMIEVCHQNNVILQVNHQRRFMPVKARFSRGILNTGTHLFDRLRQLFGELYSISGNYCMFGNQLVEVEYIDSDEHIFEIDCTRSSERMILRGVEHLVDCLDKGHQSISSGEEAKRTLEALLFYERNR